RPHLAPDLELDDALGGHVDFLERARVLRAARAALLDLEHAELAELQAVPLGQLDHDLVQEGLQDLLHHHLGLTCGVRDATDEFLLRGGVDAVALHCTVSSVRLGCARGRGQGTAALPRPGTAEAPGRSNDSRIISMSSKNLRRPCRPRWASNARARLL